MTSEAFKPKALLFDVFGTVVNWRLTITQVLQTRAASTLSSPETSLPSALRLRASAVDWAGVAQEWRDAYMHFTRSHAAATGRGEDPGPFKTIDQHHHDSLRHILSAHQLDGLWTADECAEIALSWHFLLPWPDAAAGVTRLNERGLQACTLSNGNVALLEDMARFAHLPWHRIFSSEHFGVYKPAPEVYRGAVKELGVEAGECAMVAAHLADLKAARGCGLRTIYVERAQEEAWSAEEIEKAKREGWVDIWVGLEDGDEGGRGFLEVARRLATG